MWGWRGRLRRLSGGLVKLRPGAEEVRYRLAEVAARQYIGGSRMVMVANPKGGARTTTTTLMLAHTLAAESASTSVLARCGFAQVAELIDPDEGPVWRWEHHLEDTPANAHDRASAARSHPDLFSC